VRSPSWYRRDAKRQKNPAVAGPMLENAREVERLAERMRRFRRRD
jgi:hypothetical protein